MVDRLQDILQKERLTEEASLLYKMIKSTRAGGGLSDDEKYETLGMECVIKNASREFGKDTAKFAWNHMDRKTELEVTIDEDQELCVAVKIVIFNEDEYSKIQTERAEIRRELKNVDMFVNSDYANSIRFTVYNEDYMNIGKNGEIFFATTKLNDAFFFD